MAKKSKAVVRPKEDLVWTASCLTGETGRDAAKRWVSIIREGDERKPQIYWQPNGNFVFEDAVWEYRIEMVTVTVNGHRRYDWNVYRSEIEYT